MNVAPSRLPPLLTVADFIDWPVDGTDMRYELVDGVLRAMAPASDTHATIQANLLYLIGAHLRAHKPDCRTAATPGIQPRLRAEWNFRIPDIGVTCAPNRPGDIMLPAPLLLVEVLSPGNANDTWDNIPHYASLPNPAVTETSGSVHLASIGLDLPLAEIYRGTHLA